LGCANKSLSHLFAGSIVGKNVDEQVNMIFGTIDVSNEPVYETIVVAEQFRIITGKCWKLTEILDQRGGLEKIAREDRRAASL
jgi:hypothetical protein